MKRNGNNIIFSDDVTIESGSNKGKNLREILEAQDKAIKELRSNVKWIYQYGGVGSGSGGGGGTSSPWSISARLGDQVLINNSEPINFPEAGTYKLYLHINNPGGDTFTVTYSYTYNNVKETKTVRLTQDNNWTAEKDISISGNASITITALDGNGVDKSITGYYITNSYSFNCFFADNQGIGYTVLDNSLFISTIKAGGLKVAVNYYLATTSLGIVNYSYTNFNDDTGSGSIDSSTSSEGTILLDAFTDISSVTNNSAGNYKFTIQFLVNGIRTNKTLSVNLIPEGLYLKVVPEKGIIYQDEKPTSNWYEYYTGSQSFALTPYNGSTNQGRSFPYTVSLDGVIQEEKINNLEERKATNCVLNFTTTGWHEVIFTITDSSTATTKTYKYWIYTEELKSDLNWYPINPDEEDDPVRPPVHKSIYKQGITDQTTSGFSYNDNGTKSKVNGIITMYANSDARDIDIDDTPSEANDCLICIGIQYSATNDDTKPILTINSDNDANSIIIYQNKIVRGVTELGSMYLGKEETYGATIASNYHLISIYRRFIRRNDNTGDQLSELCVYMDGVLELVYPNYITTQEIYRSIKLSPSNYFINLLEVSYFKHNSPEDKQYTYMTDAGIVRYWYTYKQRIQGQTSIETKLLNYIENGFSLSDDNHVEVTVGSINSIARSTDVPVLVLKYDEAGYNPNPGEGQTSIPRFIEWSDKIYGANSNDSSKLNIGIAWSNGNSEVQDIDISNIAAGNGSIAAQFTLDIQGSTTRTYHAKNYTLGIQAADSTAGYTPLFSPRFNPNDTNTYLPEKAFTLKADVVDSSHSNNTSMGAFVNANTSKFTQATVGDTGKYTNYVKNCLTGFPILVFVQINNPGGKADKTECYYLGIYNCNLGRSSYFNLGYCATSNLPDDLRVSDNGFCVCAIQDSAYALKPNLTVSEISDNNIYWDFSEYGSSILFTVESGVDKQFMFDDTESGADPSITNQRIQAFVEHTARAGGYVFYAIGKRMRSHKNSYREKGSVPNVYDQYNKSVSSTGVPSYKKDDSRTPEDPTQNDLIYYISGQTSGTGTVAPYVDFPSLVEYYTVCMAFGLLDSVQKNLNIKTWNSGGTFYFAFYDMDTCLGIDNDGKDSTYFAFSDFWEDKSVKDSEEDYYNAKPVEVYRDYFDKSQADGIVGYDIASSYAFAVAKYARAMNNKDEFLKEADLQSPQNLWATWRQGTGPLANADKFMETYYSGYMKNVDELMFNFNYRHKYLLTNADKTGFSTEISRFKGRRISYVREWLNGRLHILDAYFNIIGNTSITISDGKEYLSRDKQYYEAYPNANVTDTTNNDIYVIKDIFGSDQSYQDNLSFIIKAPDYSPLIMKMGDSLYYRYLLKKSTNKYKIATTDITGNNKWIFGGSALWTYLDSINSFVRTPFNISTNRLTTLNGNSGTVRSWNLNMPALQDVSLTSSDYQGELVFDASAVDNFPNLNNIDISNSRIQLKVVAENVKTVNLSYINTSSVKLSDCNALKTVTFGNSTISECIINPIWTNEIILRGNRIKYLTLDAKEKRNASLTIADSALEELTLTNFERVTIETCTKLKKITVDGPYITSLAVSSENSANNLENVIINATNLVTLNLGGCSNLKSLTINGTCDKLTTFNIDSAKLSSITYNNIPNTDSTLLDLSPMTSLSSVTIRNNPVVTKIRFANNRLRPIPIYTPFENCTYLERVYGNLIIGCDSCFKGLTRFSIHGKTSEAWGNSAKTRSNGVVLMPLEILSNIGTSDDHDTIVAKLNGLISYNNNQDPNVSNPIFYNTSSGWWKDGDNVTNIQFDRKKKVLDQICNDTSCTQFDIYYILNALALSNMKVDQLGYRSFWGNNSGEKRFAFNEGNQPNRYMFYGCSSITSISEMITGSDNTKFPCPDHDAEGNVTIDNGLISPLVNLTSFARLFDVGGYISRFFFRRKNDTTHPTYPYLTNISYQDFPYIYDEIDSLDYSRVNSLEEQISSHNDSVIQKMGNMTDFFKDLPKLTSINAICSPSYLNYDTLKILTGVTTVINSFNTSYGRGTIDLQKIFSNKRNLDTISNSFKVSNASTDYNHWDRDGKVKFPITSGMFNGFTNLQNIGYHDTVDNNGGFTNITVDNWTGNPNTITGFNGSGLRKYINQSEFPYKIFDPCKDVLVNCPGLFQDIQLIDGGDYAGITPFEFPGDLFSECRQLRNVAAFLKNCNIPYKLISEGFKDCTKLENITQIFYHDVSNNNNSQLEGQIPAKLFYHGHVKTSKVYYGTDDPDEAYTKNAEGVITWKTKKEFDFNDSSHIKTVYFANYNRKIRYAFQAFYGCGSIEKYDVNYVTTYGNAQNLIDRLTPTTTTEGTPWENIEYVNTSYIPFKYTISKESGMWKIRKDSKQETVLVDISKIYDGKQDKLKAFLGDTNIDQVFCYEDISTDLTPARSNSEKKGSTLNFFCAPDLLSYMKNTSTESANVIGMFKWCGSGEATNGIDISSWMRGRICPYLLVYLNEVRDFSEFFYNCKGLSSLAKLDEDNKGEEETYLIPKDFFSYAPKITTLNGTFQGVYFGNNPFLGVFNSLKNNSLDIRGIFAACRYDDQDENTYSISGIFSTNKLTDIAGAFCYKAVSPIKDTKTNRINITSGTYQEETINEKISWNNNFPESVQTSIKSSWIRYLYYGYSNEHAKEQYIDLSTNYNLGTSGN